MSGSFLSVLTAWLPLVFSTAGVNPALNTAPYKFTSLIPSTLVLDSPKCVHIYYDRAPADPSQFEYGRIQALFLQNLISHFPSIQQFVIPIEAYQKGQLDECFANFYIGTYFDNAIPADFLTDFVQSRSQNVWMGYNVWKLTPEATNKTFNAQYTALSTLDWTHLDPQGEPGFYRHHEYKGEVFSKISHWSPKKDPSSFQAAFEIVLMELGTENTPPQVISWAQHSSQSSRVPYILRHKNFWYVAESPFSFISLSDRYLIMADVLFDILDEAPRYPDKKPALVRFEDIHVKIPRWQLQSIEKVATRTQTPVSISLIPIFADPFMHLVTNPKDKRIPATQDIQFVQFLKDLENSGSAIIWHGVTHQYEEEKNPNTGMSGADCEFWDCAKDSPLQADSASFVVNRLEEGRAIFEQAGLSIAAWLTPHYSSSPLDTVFFGQLFDWNVGRENYVLYSATQQLKLPSQLNLQQSGTAQNGKRLPYLQDLALQLKGTHTAAQFLPYESYGDAYGLRLIPENAGFIQPGLNPEIGASESVDRMLTIIKRNRVLRDVWASFFLHPFLFNDKANGGLGESTGDTAEIERLIQTTKSYGYEFVDLNSWRKKQGGLNSKPPKEVFLEP